MVAGLCAKFHLTESSVRAPGGLAESLGEQVRIHEVGAGAGGQKSAVPHQPHAPQVDLLVAFDRVLDGAAGFGERGGI